MKTHSSVNTCRYKRQRKASKCDAFRPCSRVSSGVEEEGGKRTSKQGQKKKTELINNKEL